jgi:hypothetical protein
MCIRSDACKGRMFSQLWKCVHGDSGGSECCACPRWSVVLCLAENYMMWQQPGLE